MAENCPSEESSRERIIRQKMPGDELSGKKIPSEELSGRRIVRVKKISTKNCPGEELSSEELYEQRRRIVRFT
jgi:hypothetical protein